jgi:hypothetical protein
LLGLSGISPNDKLSPAIGLRFSSVVSQMPRIHKGMSQREVYRIMNLEDAVPSSIGGSIHGRYTTFCIPPMFELSLTFKHELLIVAQRKSNFQSLNPAWAKND